MVILAIQLVKQSSAVFVLAELAFRGQIPGKSKHKACPSLYLIPEIMLSVSINRNFVILQQRSHHCVPSALPSLPGQANWKVRTIPVHRESFLSSPSGET